MKLDRTEARVLGALIEKRWTVPDQYPLSLNALVAACNQKSNRAPVLSLAEFEVSGCLMGLRQRNLVMVHEQYGGRVPRYSEKLMDELNVSREEMAILTELLLRGPQTAGELFRRCKRMAHYTSQQQVDAMLRDLAGGHFVYLQPKASGQRYARWGQRLCPDGESSVEEPEAPAEPLTDTVTDTMTEPGSPPLEAAAEPRPTPAAPPSDSPPSDSPPSHGPPSAPASVAPAGPSLREELDALRQEVTALRSRVAALESAVLD